MTYHIFGGDEGHYKITKGNTVAPVAFVRRNQDGGGYTAEMADGSKHVTLRHMPKADTSDEQAQKIMAALAG